MTETSKKNNPLLKQPLDEFFKRIGEIQGTLLHIESSLNGYSKIRTKKPENSIKGFVLGSRLIIGDLTGPTDNGWKINYPTEGLYTVEISNFHKSITNLVKREIGYSLAQAYESFSTYLRNILALYFENNVQKALDLKIIGEKEKIKNVIWIAKIREFNPNVNNKKIFKLLRTLCANLETSEEQNNENLDLKDWYLSYSFYRHKITHSNGRFTSSEENFLRLNKLQLKYLKSFFPYYSNKDLLIFNVERKIFYQNLTLLAEYAFLIFKELSLTCNYNWKIFEKMK